MTMCILCSSNIIGEDGEDKIYFEIYTIRMML